MADEIIYMKRDPMYWWIWIWYNDFTRISLFFGVHLVPLALVLNHYDFSHIREALSGVYIFTLGWMLADNDYTNLHKIGLTVYRKKTEK